VSRLRPPGGKLLLAGALLFCAPPLLAQGRMPAVPGAPGVLAADPGSEGLTIPVDHFELEPVTAAELAGAATLAQTSPRLQATASGDGLRVDGGLQVMPVPTTIERELPLVWEYRRRVGDPVGSMPRVRVDVENGAGLAVQVRDSPVGRRDGGDGTEVFFGGVTLVIPVDALPAQGRLRTRLLISVEVI